SLRNLLQVAADRAGFVSTGGAAPREQAGAPRVIAGLSGAAKALAIATAARHDTAVTLIVPSGREIDALIEDIRFFLAALEGWSAADAERFVLPYPSQEVDPYRGLAPHFDVASARARALYGLATGAARVVVASVDALMPRLSPPERLRRASI